MSPQESRREKRLESIDKVSRYIAEDKVNPKARGIDALKSVLKADVMQEHDEQHQEFNDIFDQAVEAREAIDLLGDYDGEDDRTFASMLSAADADELAQKALSKKKASVGEFVTKHLDVIQQVAIEQAESEGVKINIHTKS